MDVAFRERLEADAVAALDTDDLTPVRIYADFLIEHGEPRGEFIALQLEPPTPKSLRRQTTLWRRHHEAWLGEAAPMLTQVHFERGFLHEARLSYALPQRPAVLQTLRRLVCKRGDAHHREHQHELCTHPILNGLREIRGHLEDRTLAAWCEGPPRPLVHLDLPRWVHGVYDRWSDIGEAALENPAGLPALRSWGHDQPSHPQIWERPLRTAMGLQVRRLEVVSTIPNLTSWAVAFPTMELRIQLGSRHLTVHRTATERLVFECKLGRLYDERRSVSSAQLITEVLGVFPDACIGAIDVQFPAAYAPTAAEAELLQSERDRVSEPPST